MEVAHIYIYGVIDYLQDESASSWGFVNLKDVKNQLDAQKEAKEILVHIHSEGGSVTEGFAIHDFLRAQGKPITTQIEGTCYSIATVIALAGDKRKMTSNADFMIHNPWGLAGGESKDIQQYADDLKKEELRIADFYAAKTNMTSEEALEAMKATTFMNAETALQKGFITEIDVVMKAVALLKSDNSNKSKMTKESEKEIKGFFAKLEEGFTKMFEKTGGKFQALKVTDADGKEIDFPDVEDRDPEIGDKATVDGNAASGEYLMPDGKTFVFESGALTEIKEVEADTDESEEMAALKAENEALKAEKEAAATAQAKAESDLAGFKAEAKTQTEALQSQFVALKSQLESEGFKMDAGGAKGSGGGEDPKPERKPFKKS
jgi:ATP-dependent Clp endopeptidase proteolytic subunit ClpP